jgi:hypothetical protein
MAIVSSFVGNIVEGHFNDTPLAGLKWGGTSTGEWQMQTPDHIDERADAAQRVALETIISGGACEPLSNFSYSRPPAEFCDIVPADWSRSEL